MSKDENQAEERLDIALERIAAERVARTGRLDIGNLGLTALPASLSELEWLEELRLSGVVKLRYPIYRLSGEGSWEETNEAYNPNRIKDLAPSLISLPHLRILDCSGADLQDLTPLAGLSALQSLDCGDTPVTDLTPLSGLTELRSLSCRSTQITDLTPLSGLTALQSLDCGDTPVTDLAPLSGLTELRSLSCRSTQVADLTPLSGLTALESLFFSGNFRVSDLTPLSGLTALQSLDFQASIQVADLNPLSGLTALQSLNCKRTPVADLTPLTDLTELRFLDCSFTRIIDLTPLDRLFKLRSLDCYATYISDLSPLAGLTALRSFTFRNTSLIDRPTAIDLAPLRGLTALQTLDFSYGPVDDLSPLSGLTSLQSLNCSYTEVADLTPLAGLFTLQSLDCLSTLVSDLAPLSKLTSLQSLDCSYTEVADLVPLAGLPELQSLDCYGTQVADLTPLAGLAKLRSLNAFDTCIREAPRSVIDLPGLDNLVINTPGTLRDIPAEVLSEDLIDNCLHRLRSHFADLDAAGEGPLRDIKVIVLGNGRVGKTQLCRRLREEPFEVDEDSTHGIRVTSVELAMPPGEEPAVMNLWDFGGQDIYHSTHALFMRTRAVFLLVWTPDSEQGENEHGGMVFSNQPLPYWLEYIRHLGGDKSPVILVQNQCDSGLGESPSLPVDEALLRTLLDDDRLFTRVPYSAKDDTGRPRLMGALQQAVNKLRESQGRPLIGRNRLVIWDQLRAWRDADARETDEMRRRHRLLPYRDFEALCREQGVHSPETFAEVLHHAGMVFYRPNLFDNRLVLDQSWVLDAVYAVFTREGAVYDTLRRLGGRFTRPILDALLWRARRLSEDDQESLLGMMETSGICFIHRDWDAEHETEYVAPDLLPEGRGALAEELAARWEPFPGEPLEAAFAYPFLSPSIARSVLSELGELAGSTALYWRYGLCLYDAESRATAIIDEVRDAEGYGGQIRISVKGANGADGLLRTLIERIKELNEQTGWPNSLLEAGMPTRKDPTAMSIEPATPPAIPPEKPEVYVSYAWAREQKDPLVEELCAALEAQGLHIRRDSNELQPGDRISRYMERLSTGRCVVLVLSEAYLRSEFCMTELYRLYANARQRDDEFLRRVVPLVQDDARIGSPRERIAHAVHWKTEHEELDTLIREYGAEIIGAEDFRRFKLIGEFYYHVGDMLAYANDFLVPRDRQSLSQDRFAMVKGLIERAIA